MGVVSGFCPLHSAKVLGCAKFQSVVRSMEVVRFSEVAFTLSLCKLQSVPQGLSTVERQSASQRVRYGRLHCIFVVAYFKFLELMHYIRSLRPINNYCKECSNKKHYFFYFLIRSYCGNTI